MNGGEGVFLIRLKNLLLQIHFLSATREFRVAASAGESSARKGCKSRQSMPPKKHSIKLRSSSLNFLLISISTVILAFTLIFSQIMVNRMERDERDRVKNWAITTLRQADMAIRARSIFAMMETEERQYAMIWSYAYEQVFTTDMSSQDNFEYLRRIMTGNQRPFILVDPDGKILESHDPEVDPRKTPVFEGEIKERYSQYPPLMVDAQGTIYQLYFKPSEVFLSLRSVFRDLDSSFVQETLTSTASVPVLITDESQEVVLAYSNLDPEVFYSKEAVHDLMHEMMEENTPISLSMPGLGEKELYVFYESSSLVKNMRFFPLAILLALLIVILGILSLLDFAKKMEQNQVWWGMSKETAHQLGTPLSSLLAWIDYYKLKEGEPMDPHDLAEIEKDVKRIELVTNRFSKIGSVPELNWENIVPAVYKAMFYLKARSSSRVAYSVNVPEDAVIMAQFNEPLIEWVIENLCKNALNAIEDNVGAISITIEETEEHVIIDVHDTGKGMSKSMFTKIFEPGFTTKKRGWGVGLTLCKRIVEKYHKGKIFVKNSTLKVGTTFRVVLNKDVRM